MKKLICFALLLQLFAGCGFEERESELARRSALLAQREQALIERENALTLKEKELRKMQQMIDSIRVDSIRVDSTFKAHPELIGSWNVVMTCIETTCPGSAIGDTKTENWVFSYEQNHLLATAMVNNKVVRIYTGQGTNQSANPVPANKPLELTANIEATTKTPSTKMIVRIIPGDKKTMDGQREIIREDGCRIVYSLKLTR